MRSALEVADIFRRHGPLIVVSMTVISAGGAPCHGGYQAVPDGSARRPCRDLRRLRLEPRRL